MYFATPEFNAKKRRLEKVLTIHDLRTIAQRRTPKAAFDYTEGAAEAEISLARARQAFEDIQFNPSILRDVSVVDTSSSVLGGPTALPFGIAPTGRNWFQFYMWKDRDRSMALVDRAAKSGLHPGGWRRWESMGIDGIILSNHGGRQLDRAPIPFHLLPDVAREVGTDLEVHLDTGIMSGADIVAAIALGADFTLVGRAYLYGLMAGGREGVDRMIEILSEQITRTMRLLGVTSLAELTPAHITQLERLAPRALSIPAATRRPPRPSGQGRRQATHRIDVREQA